MKKEKAVKNESVEPQKLEQIKKNLYRGISDIIDNAKNK